MLSISIAKALAVWISWLVFLGTAVGTGLIFSALIIQVGQNPFWIKRLAPIAVLGFSLCELSAFVAFFLVFILI